mgnify:CR=1 FL=1
MIKFAERLRELRKERHVTQKDMGEILGIQLRSYQCYESGDRRPDYEKLVALADYFDVTTDYLLGRSDVRGEHGMGRRPAATGILLPQGACPAGMHPPFLFCLAKRETGRARSKEKGAGRAPVQWPSARTGVGVPVPAPIWPCLRAR